MKKIILIGIFALLFASGCIRQDILEPVSPEYFKGTTGLIINPIRNLPPDTVWKGNSFVISVELRNAGATDIEQGIISISGLDPDYMQIQEPKRNFDLYGKQAGYPEGESKIINFDVNNIGIKGGKEQYTASFSIRGKYDYKTIATEEVCINPDIYSPIKTQSICEMQPITIRGGQGAPVAVTKIDSYISPKNVNHEVSFIFHVSNAGKGKLLNKELNIESAALSNNQLECPEKIQFDNEKDNLIECTIILENLRGAYLAPLSITLEYEYENVVDKRLNVVDLLLQAKNK